jgi:tRNA U34 5-methylaminomethyl-2-thiouridine-forming methyltransferase MnmC
MSVAGSPPPLEANKFKAFEDLRLQVQVTIPTIRALLTLTDDTPSDPHSYVRGFFPASPPATPELVSDSSRLSSTPPAFTSESYSENIAIAHGVEWAVSTRKERSGRVSRRRQYKADTTVPTHSMVTRRKRKLRRRATTFLELDSSGRASKVREPKKRPA